MELSTEQKAEAYERAIKKASEFYNNEECRVGMTPVDLESIFPELKESEDEKIRKALVRFHKSTIDIDGIKGENVLAWLEMQGEQKPNYCHHEVDLSECSEEYRKAYYDGWNNCNMQHSQCKSELDDVIKCLINGMKFYYEDNEKATWGTDKWSMPVKHIIEVLEKQGEQKPAHPHKEMETERWREACKAACVDSNYRSHYGLTETRDDYFVDGVQWADENPKQKHAEWSEDDEAMRNFVTNIFKDSQRNGASEIIMPEQFDKIFNWLNSIEDRVQPKQEWSEEDRKKIIELVGIFESAVDGYTANFPYRLLKDYIRILKSCIPQSTWKPSDGQIEALESATENCAYSEYQDCLRELIGQLKKLKE